MSQQWVLPGALSPYFIVWARDAEKRPFLYRVPPSLVLVCLEGWLRNHRQTVREMANALEPAHPVTVIVSRQRDTVVKSRLSEAFSSGRFVALSNVRPPSAVPSPLLSPGRSTFVAHKPKQGLGLVMWDKSPTLRLRSVPEPGTNEVGHLPFNTRVQITKELPGGWLAVSTPDGRMGFAATDYIWCAPAHPIPEPNAKLHRVLDGLQGTAIAIAELYYSDAAREWGSDLRFFVAVLAAANQRPIPSTTSGWMSLRFNADELIWIPSKAFAKGLRGKVNSGSYSYQALDGLGIASGIKRAAQLLEDLTRAILLSLRHIPKAVAEHVEHSLRSVISSLLQMAVGSILLLAICTAAGAAFGGGRRVPRWGMRLASRCLSGWVWSFLLNGS